MSTWKECLKNSSTNVHYTANALFRTMTASKTGIDFVNEVADTKDFNVFKYRNF